MGTVQMRHQPHVRTAKKKEKRVILENLLSVDRKSMTQKEFASKILDVALCGTALNLSE